MENEKIILYSTHCPKCKILEKKLSSKNIAYEEIDDVDKMLSMGIKEAPVLDIGDNRLTFNEAIRWVQGA